MSYLQALILAIIEGITEFLPISSTGHMAIASAFMQIEDKKFNNLFEVVIQLGAILSVVIIFRQRFFDFKNVGFYIKLFIAIIPALVFGAIFKSHIDAFLEKPLFIAVVMLVGGIILLFLNSFFHKFSTTDIDSVNYKQAFIVGCFQVLSILFPGLSRSAATIIGGMQQGMSMHIAAQFSFMLAVPTMLAASVKSTYDVYKDSPEVLNTNNLSVLIFGFIVAFIVAYISVTFFMKLLNRVGFKPFGWYRIALGSIIIILSLLGKLN